MLSRQTSIKLSISLITVFLCFLTLELLVRALSTRDIDGEWRFRSTRLRPFALPVNRASRDIEKYLQSDRSSLIHDEELGWTQRPSVADHNDAGFITTGSTPPLNAPDGSLRIALFGDSFTQGTYREGWWRVLEEYLQRDGIPAEVLNFGVGGYGMDQAYLRWKRDGRRWKPNVVIFGFFAEDCYRNMNVFRMLRDPDSGIPFSKPRFLTAGDSELQLINSPTVPLNQIASVLKGFGTSNLARHEWFFRPSDFQMNAFRWSKLAALVESKILLARKAAEAEEFFQIHGEASQIALRILQAMSREVAEDRGSFIVAHLPGITELESIRRSGVMPHQALYAEIQKQYSAILLEESLLAAANGQDLGKFFHDGHYRGEFNRIVGETIAAHIRKTAKRGDLNSNGESRGR